MPTRTKTKPRAGTIAEEEASMGTARGRSGRGRVDEDTLSSTRRLLRECFGAAVDGLDLERYLTHAEALELAELVRLVYVEQKAQAADYFEPAATVEAFAARAEQLAAEARGPDNKRKGELLAEFARERGRTPNVQERDAILRGAKPDSTLASLSLPVPTPQTVSRGFRIGELDADERVRFEALIEKACGQEPGAIFEKERERRRFGAKLAELADRVAPGPRKRSRPTKEPAGTAFLPRALLDDLLATRINEQGDTQIMVTAAGVAVFAVIAMYIENRTLPAACTRLGARFEDDGNVIVVHKDLPLFGVANVEDRVQGWRQSLDDLSRAGWLTVARSGNEVRIGYGPKMVSFLSDRQEAGT